MFPAPTLRLLPAVFLLLSAGPVAVGDDAPAPQRIAAAGLSADVDLLQQLYERAHPGLFRYLTRSQWDAHLAALRAEFERDRTLAEAYVAISRFLAKIQCGHSYANFFNQSPAIVKSLFAGQNRVPFLFRWIDDRMIVTRDLVEPDRLRPGTEIVSIAGTPVAEIFRQLRFVARADGGNDAKRTAYLELTGTDRYEAFDIFLPLLYPQVGKRIELEARAPGENATRQVVVEAQTQADRDALPRTLARTDAEDGSTPWTFAMLDPETACLRMPSWALYNARWDWKAFLDRGIDDLIERGVPSLIVDLRGNEGGLDCGDVLLERLISEPIAAPSAGRFVRYRRFPVELEPYVSTWDPSFKDWGDRASEVRSGYFRLSSPDGEAGAEGIRPRGRRYPGRVAVLTDASNSSATFQFAQLVKQYKIATLVGQPTGGNLRGINGGAFFFATLPNSGIEVDLPLIARFPSSDEFPDGTRIPLSEVPDRGIEPDVMVAPSVDDIAHGIDTELEAARALLRERARPN